MKIVQDKLPETCSGCNWFVRITGKHFWCKVMGFSVSDASKRPDFCPLMTEEQALSEFDHKRNERLFSEVE